LIKRLSAIAIASAIALSPAPAAARDDYSRAYVVLGGLTAFETFSNDAGLSFDTSLGFQLRGGYRFNRFLALEAGMDIVSGWNSKGTVGGPPGTGLVINGGNATVNILAYFPIGRLEPYALAGLGGMWTKVRSVDVSGTGCTPGSAAWYCNGIYAGPGGGFVMKFGGGADFYFTDAWALTVDVAYVLPVGPIEDLRYVNLGWGARFHF
jgi:opacity protein-like surface antigen